jgi:RNA 2',3'-cyclic 3'-phosphodiesterase
MRIFVALEIPEEVRRALRGLVGKLEGTCRGARWAHVEGAHVTLKFIGEASPEKVERIRGELATIRLAAPVELTFRNVGFFPNERHPRVFWAGIAASDNLGELAAEVERHLEPLGIAREQRPFRPHLTLARFKSEDGLDRLREALPKAGPLEFGATRTGELHLYQSRLKPDGAEYTRLATLVFAVSPGGAA